MDKKKIVIITGPTAVGKTACSIAVSKHFGGEIISADSMQIYREMDIGTAKVTEDEKSGIPHHIIDIVSPEEKFSVANYKQMADQVISDILNRRHLPIVVGGTGLYINSFLYDLDFQEIASDEGYRISLENYAIQHGNEALYKLLLDVDPEAESLLTPSDKKRIIRAMEIYKHTGKKLSELRRNLKNPNQEYDCKTFFLNMDRQFLYDRINARVDLMIEQGLEKEVHMLYQRGLDESYPSMQGIGYKQFVSYFKGECTNLEAIEKIKQLSRNYAKRQITWFKKDPRVEWIDRNPSNLDHSINEIIQKIEKWRNYEPSKTTDI